jgi:hypothetical protein
MKEATHVPAGSIWKFTYLEHEVGKTHLIGKSFTQLTLETLRVVLHQ